MWRWDQGHLAYFQFDTLRAIAGFSLGHDLATANDGALRTVTGLPFASPYPLPWRNYARVAKLMLLVSHDGTKAVPTAVARRLAAAGHVTADEYFHFISQTATDPSPAMQGYDAAISPRYPLLFALRYILTKAATQPRGRATFDEVIGAYRKSGFVGGEGQAAFLTLLGREDEFEAIGKSLTDDRRRQARESLRVIAQISYLQLTNRAIEASLAAEDALDAFNELSPIGVAARAADPDEEIQRRAAFFNGGSTLTFLDFPRTVISDLAQAGFGEGGRLERTHLVVERNGRLRKAYFDRIDPKRCDMCHVDTKATYRRATPVLDLHHKLPLSSGTRVEAAGTIFADLTPLCPTCHRAVHGFYGTWLRDNGVSDFADAAQASDVYNRAKAQFAGHVYA